ncbi:MAG: ATP-binding cassette domain-containing protein [Candidatus Omnitrophica bacterium]|nr:ATP-binding cassette domain-containing protein [Candidatus Omnitrophota bacterium]
MEFGHNEGQEQPSSCALRACEISKRFGAVQANDGVSLALHYGRIHALLGENGAGKSTLLSILYGLLPPDSGRIEINGRLAVIRRPGDAIRLGLGLVQQHFSLVGAFSVLENIILGREDFLLNKRRAERAIRERLQPFGLDLPLHRRVETLPVGLQQQVEIARILVRQARIMLFDEPTAALTSVEIDSFLGILTKLREQGIAVALITHRLPEVMRSADEVTVMRRGRVVFHAGMADASADRISEAIVGERLPEERYDLPEPGRPLLQANGAQFMSSSSVKLAPLTFDVREREILGVAGVAGNGQEEIIDGLLGRSALQSGELLLQGDDLSDCSLAGRKRRGMAYIPQDRINQALLPRHSVFENYALNRFSLPGGERMVMPRRALAERMRRSVGEFQIQTPSLQTGVSRLSGGHQQRLVISRELLSRPRLIIAHDPARGLDLRAARFVHENLMQQCRGGAGVILFSSEWTELFLLCRRIAVLYRGALAKIQPADQWTAQDLGRCMVGWRQEAS